MKTPPGSNSTVDARPRHRRHWFWWTLAVVVVLLVAARLAMPSAIRDYVNRRLNRVPGYSGSIKEIRVHLWRGAYEIVEPNISKSNGKVPVPFFSASNIDLSVQWNELLHGAVVGSVALNSPQVNFVAADNPQQSQTGESKPWGDTLKSLLPLRLNLLKINDAHIHFRDFQKNEPVDLYLTNLYAIATNLTNVREKNQPLPAGLNCSAQTIGGGNLLISLHMDPLDKDPTFQLNASLTNVDMLDLNNFLRAYGKFDVAHGNMQLFISAASLHGTYKGVVKVLFKHLDVFQWQKERGKNVLEVFWDAVVGALVEGFKNHAHDQLATEFPIDGTFKSSHPDVWEAIGSLLKNGFIRALLPDINHPVHLQEVRRPGLPPAQNPPVSLPADMKAEGH